MDNSIIRYFEEAFKEENRSSASYKTVNGIIVILILISSLEVILSTESYFKIYENYLHFIFFFTSSIFLIEFGLRIYIKKKTDVKFTGLSAYKSYFLDF